MCLGLAFSFLGNGIGRVLVIIFVKALPFSKSPPPFIFGLPSFFNIPSNESLIYHNYRALHTLLELSLTEPTRLALGLVGGGARNLSLLTLHSIKIASLSMLVEESPLESLWHCYTGLETLGFFGLSTLSSYLLL